MSWEITMLDDAGAVVVIIGEQAETGVEPSAAFAGVNQRDVKLGQPAAVLQAVGERPALGEFVQKMLERFAERAGGRIAFDLFQRGHDADAGGRELGELMIKLGALGELAGRDDERHNARAGFRPRRGRGWL